MPSTISKNKPKPSWQFEAIGTHWSIETLIPLDGRFKDVITKRIDDFDAAYSRFRDDSIVDQVAYAAGTYVFPDDSIDLVQLYEKLYAATDGAVTPLIGDALAALGYDKNYSLKQRQPAMVKEWQKVMNWDDTTLTTKQPLTLDFGAVGKGYLVDSVAEILESNDIGTYVIDASGDIRHQGADKQTIGLEDPRDPTRVIGVAELQNASLCASASNRRKWGKGLHHVIDGRTGNPTDDVVATWVIADTTAISDGVATALFFVDADHLSAIGEFQFVRLYNDGHVEYSQDFVGQLFV